MSTQQSMNVMKYHILVWKICGVWPPDHKPLWYTFYSIILFGIVFAIFPSLIVLNLFIVTNLNGVIETLLPCSTCALASIKAYLIYQNRKELVNLFDIIRQLDAAVKTEEERNLIGKALKESKQLIILFSFLYYGGVNSAFLLAFLSKDTILMWPSWFPFSYENNMTLYNCIIFYQYISSLFVAIIDTSADLYGSCLNKVLRAHLEVLGMQLETLGFAHNDKEKLQNFELELRNNESNADLINLNQLKDCAIYHNLCIR